MPVSALSVLSPNALDDYVDLRSVPKLRHFGKNDVIDRLRLAVPFDYIFISGLDVDHYRFGEGFSIDTDLPPAYLEAYEADQLIRVDPFVHAAKSATTVVAENEVYKEQEPPQRLLYLQRTFGVFNRTIVPIHRDSTVYGAVGFTRATAFDDDEITFLALVSEAIHTAVTKPLMERFAAEHMRLSKGEMACLAQASLGLTSEGIAKSTGYQLDTVNSYVKSATKKLGAVNRTQAIAEAIRRRLIA
ncbi:helix-turn-helix transcriptional regulator [Rhizobium leguminosarum]|jgi:LuxR family transcriptional regulator|uniref:LuxR family transcriptional regulator n=1 Tax=Rhizobium leguminosarum TaxID=384 RepID=A0A4Q8XR76_RHILE|nr:autoinducer binding domain-containing protein [Rhizobium leguminosarum]TAU73091.1 LuxR family transcriptional regulator [Rhizobium leguminosarum]TAU79261.1 LuxR family transcriptional regulator [Rhizobium leguminosarum]TAV40779.1 LuxR family transcriptional regulator [Rhizobium leguminosarum]TAV41712.1 LuxR family transcriptional regulator [Rhizobium leguminosarum]TAV42179.1 LuxR family transcriptional regulator [Rhizobium leguminosarum]